MKPAILIGSAFLLGLAGSTLLGMRRPAAATDALPTAPPPAAAGPPASPADSAAKLLHPPLIAAPPAAAHDSVAPHVDSAAHTVTRSGTDQLVAAFAKLSPQDIAPIAENINDSTLVPVLAKMGAARVAAVLAALPPARAKTLSKRLLVPDGAVP